MTIQTLCAYRYSQRILRNFISRKESTLAQAQAVSAGNTKPKPFKEMPGLSALPVIGTVHYFLPVIGKIGPPGNFYEMITKLYENYGPIVRVESMLGRGDMAILFEPDHYDQVYRAEEVLPLRPGFAVMNYYMTEMRKDRYNGMFGLTTAQYQDWRNFRTKVNPVFLKPKLVKLYEPALGEIARDAVKRLMKVQEDPDYLKMNFDFEITRFSLESVAFVGLGARIGCLEDNLNDEHPAKKLLQCSKIMLDLGFKLELNPLNPWKYIATPGFKKLIKAFDTQWDISAMYIEEAKRRINARDHDIPEEDKSIIEKLLAVDEKVAIMMGNEMLIAGIDTVAYVTTGLLYELATNPDVQNKLREEIRNGSSKRYLKACIKEALRLHPVISSNLRRTTKEHVVGGYVIPVGVDVVAPNEYLSRMEKYYPRPLEFIPERWIAEKSDPLYYGNTNAMVTLPFGFGIRSCIGRRIAELEIELLVHYLIHDYNVLWDGPPIQVTTRVMNAFKKPFCFRFNAAT